MGQKDEIGELADALNQMGSNLREMFGKTIEGIQNTTDGTVTEINQIGKVIADINEIVGTIATAVEEQSTSTREIAGNVNQAALGIQDVNETWHTVRRYPQTSQEMSVK